MHRCFFALLLIIEDVKLNFLLTKATFVLNGQAQAAKGLGLVATRACLNGQRLLLRAEVEGQEKVLQDIIYVPYQPKSIPIGLASLVDNVSYVGQREEMRRNIEDAKLHQKRWSTALARTLWQRDLERARASSI